MESDFLPDVDGRFLGENLTPKRWDGRHLINLDASKIASGILATARYPDALLLDGSRVAIGDVTRRYSYGGSDYDAVLGVLDETLGYGGNPSPFLQLGNVPTVGFAWRIIHDVSIDTLEFINYDAGTGTWLRRFRWNLGNFLVSGDVRPESDNLYNLGTATRRWTTVRAIAAYFTNLSLGSVVTNLSMADDKFIKVGKDSDGALPAASATYRGMLIRVEGAAGVADLLYMCMKSAAGTYSWVTVTTG